MDDSFAGARVLTTRPLPPLVSVGAVDDHEAILRGVRVLLEETGRCRVIAVAPTVNGLLDLLEGRAVDVVLLDLHLADGSRPGDNVRLILDSGADVIVYSNLTEATSLREAIAAGALGAVHKGQAMTDLDDAIVSAAAGEPLLTTEWAAALDAAPTADRPLLSDRESEALRLYASGLEMKSAARRMDITLGTFKEYLLRVRRKYADVHRPAGTKLALYHRAVEDGYVSPHLKDQVERGVTEHRTNPSGSPGGR